MANIRILVAPRLLARSDDALATLRSLARLAAYARDVTRSRDVSSALFAALGMHADTPVAPLALVGRGGDPGEAYVLCAAPVHLEAGAGHALDVAGMARQGGDFLPGLGVPQLDRLRIAVRVGERVVIR